MKPYAALGVLCLTLGAQAMDVLTGIDLLPAVGVQLRPWVEAPQDADLRYSLSSSLEGGHNHSSSEQSGRLHVRAGERASLSRLQLSLPPLGASYVVQLRVWQGDQVVSQAKLQVIQKDGQAVIKASE